MISLPSATWCMTASSPFSNALFFASKILDEFTCIASEISTSRFKSFQGRVFASHFRTGEGPSSAIQGANCLQTNILAFVGLSVVRTILTIGEGSENDVMNCIRRNVRVFPGCFSILVLDTLVESVEGVPQTTLADQFQRYATHPVHDVQFLRTSGDLGLEYFTELWTKGTAGKDTR